MDVRAPTNRDQIVIAFSSSSFFFRRLLNWMMRRISDYFPPISSERASERTNERACRCCCCKKPVPPYGKVDGIKGWFSWFHGCLNHHHGWSGTSSFFSFILLTHDGQKKNSIPGLSTPLNVFCKWCQRAAETTDSVHPRLHFTIAKSPPTQSQQQPM